MEKGSSSSPPAADTAPDSLNGLAFGKKIYFEGPKGPPPPTPPSPAKKGRTGLVQGGQPPRCQVEGCKVDLSDAKAYYSRHKVCGVHSKTPKVIVAGLEQRFCQQCSRFHQLPEFDQGKRSCRRRLAGHNERRRKPPPGSLLPAYYGSTYPLLFDNRTKPGGGFMMDFSAYPGRDTTWPNTVCTHATSNQSATSGKPQPPWQSSSQNPIFDIHHQGTASRPGPGYPPTPAIPSEECFSGVSDSSSALSLLSNKPWVARSPPSTLAANDFLSTGGNGVTLAHPPINPGHFASSSWGFKGSHASNALHEIPPDMGLPQFSHSTNSEYAGELGLSQPNEGQFQELDHSRGYVSNIQHMHWSL